MIRLNRYVLLLLVPVFLLAFGTIGYHLIEGWPYFDALYMTVTTLTTVGFSEVHPLSDTGRAFTIVLILGGVFTLFSAAAETIRAAVSGDLAAALARNSLNRSLSHMENHVIVCGFGRMGRRVCQELASAKVPFVVIDRDAEATRALEMPGALAIAGDATSEEVLRQAGIERARALITVVASDADNLFITMSARLLSEKLFIVARAEDEHTEAKLTRAGASRVVSPYVLGGHRVAQAVLRPTVLDFLELATRTDHVELQIEEAQIAHGSTLDGKTLEATRAAQDLSVLVVAVKRPGGQVIYNPPPATTLGVGDTLVAIGHRRDLDRLDALATRP